MCRGEHYCWCGDTYSIAWSETSASGAEAGGPGTAGPPERIVTAGPYRYVRNPMYLGHLIFTLGLAVTFWSWFALALFVILAVWFHRRVLADEARLSTMFGAEYTDYQGRVKSWIPGML